MSAERSTLLYQLSGIVGNLNILTSRQDLEAYERTTFATSQRALLVVKPDSTEQVAQILALASQAEVPVYPVSRGCNWGLGSRVPIRDQSIVLDLSRMNRILSFNPEQAYIEVEPGVTFAQVSSFLRQQGGELFLSVIGGHPESSIIGNTLERGDGLGPLGDRSHFVCSLEVVLADGSVIATGLQSFSESPLTHCSKDALGPALDGLFFQSNLGIVTRMTIWLKRTAGEFASGMITFESREKLLAALPALRKLQEQGVIQGNCMAVWNIHKILAAAGQHPLQQTTPSGERAACLTEENLSLYLPRGLKNIRWLVTIALYAPTTAHMRLNCRLLRAATRPYAKRRIIITRRLAWIGRLLSGPVSLLAKLDLNRWLNAFYYESVYQGYTSELSIRSLYWRKPGEIPARIDPDADRCGLLWLCHLIPFTPAGVEQAEKLATKICADHGFEPNLALLNTSERACRMFIAIMYDRNIEGEDERALECQNQLQDELSDSGFPSFRLGLQSMHTFVPRYERYRTMMRQLKQLFDPKSVIAPGRYDFTSKE